MCRVLISGVLAVAALAVWSAVALFATSAGPALAADSCDAVYAGASTDGYRGQYGSYEANGNCNVRNVSESTCRRLPGFVRWFPDGGSNFTYCEFAPPSGGRSASSQSGNDYPSSSRNAPPPVSANNPFSGGSPAVSANNPFANTAPPTSAGNPFAPSQSAAAPTAPVVSGGQCTAYFTQMKPELKRLVTACAGNTGLLSSDVDLITSQGRIASGGVVVLPQNTATKIFANLPVNDPRWSHQGGNAIPNCALPLQITTQAEAFGECTRVYWCAMKSADCGLAQAAKTNERNCLKISDQCLISNPIPGVSQASVAMPPPAPRGTSGPSATPSSPSGISGLNGTGSRTRSGLEPSNSAK